MSTPAYPWDDEHEPVITVRPDTVWIDHGDAPLPDRIRQAEIDAYEQASTGADAVIVEYRDTTYGALSLPDDVDLGVGLRRYLLDAVRDVARAGRDARPDLPLSTDVIAPEIRTMTTAHGTLVVIADSFKAAADEARTLAGDLVLEVTPDKDEDSIGTTSARVALPDGGTVKVSRTQGSTVSIDEGAIISVIAEHLVVTSSAPGDDPATAHAYERGVLEGIEAYRKLAAAHTLKSSELSVMADRLAADGTVEGVELATRLRAAYARVSDGRPATVKIEHKAAKA